MPEKLESFDRHIATPGGLIFVREWRAEAEKAQAPIILLHDSLGCVELWRDFPAHLSARTARRVIAYDRPGFGRSDPAQDRLPLDFIYLECAQSLPPLLDALEVEDFVLFGHSVGGGMAVAGAAHFGARCVGLVTEAAQIFWEENIPAGIRHAQGIFTPGSPPYDRLVKYHGDKAAWVLRSWIDNWLDPGFVLEFTPSIAKVLCPVLAMHGDRDEYGSLGQPRRLCEQVSGPATLHILPDCGHVPHRDRPGEVLDAVADFLRK